MSQIRFPPEFLWGAATSAYQIEGAPLADGAGPSIWQRFSHSPGKVANGDTGDVACDHYHRWRSDVLLMRELGLEAYRFSISWSRIFPDGTGRLNERGLDFYRRLVDALLESDIAPMATLYHWDLPAALHDRGGWLNRDIAGWFGDYATQMFRALDDRVQFWATLNEPWVVMDGGYLHGSLAPGHNSLFEAPIVSHNLLRAHGEALAAYRAAGGKHPIGLVVNLEPKYPATDGDDDSEANLRADAYMNRHYLDPLFFGAYPTELPSMFGEAWPDFPASDFDAIRQPVDFIGINYYSRGVTKAATEGVERAVRVRQPNAIHTEMGWEVFPQGLTDVLVWFRDRYGSTPVYITENGAAFYDPPSPIDGAVQDPLRVHYLDQHIRAVAAAMDAGVDIRGYFVWSLLDNLEWSYGFTKRFGIVHVDFATLERTPKGSARFYREVIRNGGL